MKPSLAVTREHVDAEIKKLEIVVEEIYSARVKVQYLMSEIILIRVAAILEQAFSDIAFKLAAGAKYLDGSFPLLLTNCSSMAGARSAMLSVGRPKSISNLKWTRAKFISDSVKYVIDPNDHFVSVCNRFGTEISQLFKTRNFAAHRTSGARREFRDVVRSVYGMNRPRLQLGYFLLSKNYVREPNIKRYLVEARVIVNDLVKY